MVKEKVSIIQKAEAHVKRILGNGLPEKLHYHDLTHTEQVVTAAEEITSNEGFDKEETEIVVLAAWFHDTGYIIDVGDHERCSQELAEEWLNEQNYPKEKIRTIIKCIEATRCPQNPLNKLERAICDADMYHLSTAKYFAISEKLKSELEHLFNIHHTWNEWKNVNQKFFSNHRYFTSYGKQVLSPRKARIFAKLLALKPSSSLTASA